MDSKDNEYSRYEVEDNDAINNGEPNDFSSITTARPNNPRCRRSPSSSPSSPDSYARHNAILFDTYRPYPAPYPGLQVRPMTPSPSNPAPLSPYFLIQTIYNQQQCFHPEFFWLGGENPGIQNPNAYKPPHRRNPARDFDAEMSAGCLSGAYDEQDFFLPRNLQWDWEECKRTSLHWTVLEKTQRPEYEISRPLTLPSPSPLEKIGGFDAEDSLEGASHIARDQGMLASTPEQLRPRNSTLFDRHQKISGQSKPKGGRHAKRTSDST